MNNSNQKLQRPLSPHLQVYKPQITSVMSILHRITGTFLSLGSLVMAYWLYAAAYDMVAYDCIYKCFTSILGRLLLVAWSAAFYYHLCNGIRHLMWDMGKGLEIHQVKRTGLMVLLITAVLTISTWYYVLMVN
jgi:succinate dehydrogenase / fumarate reductase, cytochrome b subunit